MLAMEAASAAGLAIFAVFLLCLLVPSLWLGWKLAGRIFPTIQSRTDQNSVNNTSPSGEWLDEALGGPSSRRDRVATRRFSYAFPVLCLGLLLTSALAIVLADAPWWLMLVAGLLAAPALIAQNALIRG
jgi:hypothetical protein